MTHDTDLHRHDDDGYSGHAELARVAKRRYIRKANELEAALEAYEKAQTALTAATEAFRYAHHEYRTHH